MGLIEDGDMNQTSEDTTPSFKPSFRKGIDSPGLNGEQFSTWRGPPSGNQALV
jgi:hypothetical protein